MQGFEGGCDCRTVRYWMRGTREAADTLVLNALIESRCATLVAGEPDVMPTPSTAAASALIIARKAAPAT